jgi:hypothetical protein
MRRPPLPRSLYALAQLRALKLELPDGTEVRWEFSPMPILAFAEPSPSPRQKRPTSLWIVGGNYRVAWDAGGVPRLTRQGPLGLDAVPIERARRENPEVVRLFQRGHGGEEPTRAVRGVVRAVPKDLIVLGKVTSIEYPDRKGDSDPQGPVSAPHRAEYGHDIYRPARPTLVTNRACDGLWFVGGSEAVVNGWLYDARPHSATRPTSRKPTRKTVGGHK